MTLLTTSNCRNVVAVVMVTTRCMLKVCPSPSLSQCMLFPQSFSNSSPLSTIMSSKWLCCVMCHVLVIRIVLCVMLCGVYVACTALVLPLLLPLACCAIMHVCVSQFRCDLSQLCLLPWVTSSCTVADSCVRATLPCSDREPYIMP